MEIAAKEQKLTGGLRAAILKNEQVLPNSELMETLKTAIPQFFKKDVLDENGRIVEQGAFDLDRFSEELKANNISEARDGYKLGFVGKDYARLQVGRKSETVIVPDMKHNSQKENTNSGNIFITGDNLEALRHLINAYENKIKLIYIDPPYNTGKEFVYSDKFEFDDEKLKNALGYTDKEIERLKSIQGKSSHSAWLTFMYPRLKLAQKLLTDDGVIFVSIDDNEQANLKLLMDDVFGEGNFVCQFVWERAFSPKNDARFVSNSHDFVFMYAKTLAEFSIGRLQRTEEANARYLNPDNDPRGVWMSSDISVKTYTPENDYPITAPSGRVIEPPAGRCWRLSKKTFSERLQDNRIWFGDTGDGAPRIKRFLTDLKKEGMTPTSILYHKDVGHSQEGSQEVSKIMDGGVFDGPKPIRLLRRLLSLANTDEDSVILDFFAGSGTTAHAVMQLNVEDGGNRKYIMVQLDEPANENSEARKAGYKTIDEIARERIKRAAKKIKSGAGLTLPENFDGGFKHYRLITPDVKTLDKIESFDPTQPVQKDMFENMVTAFDAKKEHGGAKGEEVILQTWLIDDGFTFDTKIEELKFGGYTAHLVASQLYLIAQDWGSAQTKELLNRIGINELNVQHIVVYAYSFTMESLLELENNTKNTLDDDHRVYIERRY
ncbi:MAG: site-specific DNA-methyltransferase [Planctomycetaceae bacterium]|jgi:adenine-specific DNA-methyltransferase|nr:site-specific DNA-methyltransferase [Planctomycetaceae bacterium]